MRAQNRQPAKGTPSAKDKQSAKGTPSAEGTWIIAAGGRSTGGGGRSSGGGEKTIIHIQTGSVGTKMRKRPMIDPRTLAKNTILFVFFIDHEGNSVEGSFTLEDLQKVDKIFFDALEKGLVFVEIKQSPSSKNGGKRRIMRVCAIGYSFNCERIETPLGDGVNFRPEDLIVKTSSGKKRILTDVCPDFLRSLEGSFVNMSRKFRVGFQLTVRVSDGSVVQDYFGHPRPKTERSTKEGVQYLKTSSGARVIELCSKTTKVQVTRVDPAEQEAKAAEAAEKKAKAKAGKNPKPVEDNPVKSEREIEIDAEIKVLCENRRTLEKGLPLLSGDLADSLRGQVDKITHDIQVLTEELQSIADGKEWPEDENSVGGGGSENVEEVETVEGEGSVSEVASNGDGGSVSEVEDD
jgi:hypothetical protein